MAHNQLQLNLDTACHFNGFPIILRTLRRVDESTLIFDQQIWKDSDSYMLEETGVPGGKPFKVFNLPSNRSCIYHCFKKFSNHDCQQNKITRKVNESILRAPECIIRLCSRASKVFGVQL